MWKDGELALSEKSISTVKINEKINVLLVYYIVI